MAANRIMRGGATRRSAIALAALIAATALASCGGGQGPTTAALDKAGDGEALNAILSRQLGAVAAYEQSLRGIGPPYLALARRFLAQEQEHVDATLKALRGTGVPAEAEPERIPTGRPRHQQDYLRFLYELESATIEAEVGAIGQLTAPAARTMLAATVADQAQHLVWLRRALGAKPIDTFPGAFENGTAAAP
ncbi:MAG: ferritin-like domain-containing protein [Syntrophothermus sp.]